MRRIIVCLLLGQLMLCSCKPDTKAGADSPVHVVKESRLVEIVANGSTPTVELSSYKLIVSSEDERRADAEQILALKRRWPLAMQSKETAEFESILGRNFTFKGSDSFYNRNDYIKDRTSPSEWLIVFVRYENVTLQFVGDTGILSYANNITNKNSKTGEIEYERISWVDIYVIEDGKWKIGAAHAIDYRLEIPTK